MSPYPDPPHRVLSIQSHVISGYVGNKAAAFPLQLLGYDVDILPAVTLANHTGYIKGAKGPRHTAEELATWLDGMRENHLLAPITHLLTGYIGTPGTVAAVLDALRLLQTHATPHLVFVCDPVLGDDGKLYVHRDVVDAYIRHLLPFATILTPNAFELGVLTDRHIHTEADAFSACEFLHERFNIPTVAVTGTRFGISSKTVAVLVSARQPGAQLRFALETDFIDGSFTGSGDLMAALLLAWTARMPADLIGACRKAMASVTAVLKTTVQLPKSPGLSRKPELRLVQSQQFIQEPPVHLVHVRNISS